MENSILKIDCIKKTYNRDIVLDNVSFEVEKGDVLGIVGDNGAGKTTLLKIICHLVIPDQGRVIYRGSEDEIELLSKSGVVLSDEMLIDKFSLKKNMQLKIYSLGLKKDKDEIISTLTDKLNLREFLDKECGKLSMGMKQRAAIAMALIGNPDLMILDEPFNGLDPSGVKELKSIIQEMAQNGQTILVSSHLLYDIEKLCNKVIIFYEGKVLEYKSMEDIHGCGNTLEEYYFDIVNGQNSQI